MADIKILDLTEATEITETTDYIPVVDTSDTAQDSTGTTKKATVRKLLGDRVLPDTIVGTTETQTLSGKTIDGDDNTISNLAHGLEVDNPSSGVHGVTGSIVGTTDTQTLTNKTLTSPRQTIDIKFRVNRQAASNTGNAAFAVVAFDSEQYDTGSNVSSGVFTAPISGYYTFSWNILVNCDATPRYLIASLFYDGAEYSRGTELKITASTIGSSTGSDTIYMASGKKADIRAYADVTLPLFVGANVSYCWFSGRYISS